MWVCVGCGVVEVAVLWDGVCVSTRQNSVYRVVKNIFANATKREHLSRKIILRKITVRNTCIIHGSLAVSLLSTMDFQPDSRRKYLVKVSLKWTERFKMWEQHIEHTVRRSGADRNR